MLDFEMSQMTLILLLCAFVYFTKKQTAIKIILYAEHSNSHQYLKFIFLNWTVAFVSSSISLHCLKFQMLCEQMLY